MHPRDLWVLGVWQCEAGLGPFYAYCTVTADTGSVLSGVTGFARLGILAGY